MGPIHESLSLPAPLVLGITPRSAHLLSLLFTTTYVGSLYLAQTIGLPAYLRSKTIKANSSDAAPQVDAPPIAASDVDPNTPEVRSRDHPATIRIRMKAVTTATGLSLAGVYWMVKQTGQYTWAQAVSTGQTPIAEITLTRVLD
jgi:prenyl protein peptidase